jgi:rhamnosyltransferase
MIGVVTVTYHPDMDVLAHQLSTLPQETYKVIVDNASPVSSVKDLRNLVADQPDVLLLTNAENTGLAAALNQGVHALHRKLPDIKLVLLLDQDTQPDQGSIQTLIEAYCSLEEQGSCVGAIGPQLRDDDTGLMHGFHQMTRWRWRRTFPAPQDTSPVPITNLNGSGTLMNIQLFQQLGGLDESFFIDHVDTEWSFHLLASGYRLWGIPQAVFSHRMGERGIRFWFFGWRVWPSRTSIRNCYLFRNTLLLMKRPYVPWVWKIWAAVKLMLTAVVHGIFDANRRMQIKSMWKGISQGIQFDGGRGNRQ